MSRISAFPLSRTAALAAALVTVLTLSACGREEADTAAAPQPTTTELAATTPTTPGPGDADEAAPAADATKRETIKSKEPEAIEDAERLAEKDPDTNPAPTTAIGKAKAALEKAGYDVEAYGATGMAESSLKVGTLMSIAFYKDIAGAKTDYTNFKAAFDTPNAQGAVVRKGRRLYLIATPQEVTRDQRAELRKVARVAEAAQR